MNPQPNSPQVRVIDVFRQFSEVVARLDERSDMVVIPDELMVETNPQARMNRLRFSPERYVVRSIDISPPLMRPFQALLREFIDIAVDELQQRGVRIPELQTVLSYYGNRRELDRSTLLSPSFARALNVVLNHPALRSKLVELENKLMNSQRQYYFSIQQSCSDQSDRSGRLFVIGADRYILGRLVDDNVTFRITHHQLAQSPEPLSGTEAHLVYAKGTQMLEELESQRSQRVRSSIYELFRRPDERITAETATTESPAQQALSGQPDARLFEEMFPTGRLSPEARARLTEALDSPTVLPSTSRVIPNVPVDLESLPRELREIITEVGRVEGELSSVGSADALGLLTRGVSSAWHRVFGGSDPDASTGYSGIYRNIQLLDYAMRDLSQVPFGRLTLAIDAAMAELFMRHRIQGKEIYRYHVREVISSVFSSVGIDLPASGRLVGLLYDALSSRQTPYEWVDEPDLGARYSWADALGVNPASFRDIVLAHIPESIESNEYHPAVLAMRALGLYDEDMMDAIRSRVLDPGYGEDLLYHIRKAMPEDRIPLDEDEDLTVGSFMDYIMRMVRAYGQQDVYTGRVYLFLPSSEGMTAYFVDVRDMPLPRLPLDLGFEQDVLRPGAQGLIWRGENVRRVHEYVAAGNPLVLTERQLYQIFRDARIASHQLEAAQSAMEASGQTEVEKYGHRTALPSDVADRIRNMLDFFFEGMEFRDVDDFDPYSEPAPEILLSWEDYYITGQVMIRRRIGRGRSERVLRGTRRAVRDVIPEQLILHLGAEAERRVRALMQAREQLERSGSEQETGRPGYTASGPMGSMIQVQDIDEQGNLIIREWTLEEYLNVVAPGADVSPIPASAVEFDDSSSPDVRFELARYLSRRAPYGTLYPSQDLTGMFHAVEDAYSAAYRQHEANLIPLEDIEQAVSEWTGEQIRLSKDRMYHQLLDLEQRIPQEYREQFADLIAGIRQLRETILENLRRELADYSDVGLTDAHLVRLATRLAGAYPDYREHGIVATGHAFSRFMVAVTQERLYESDMLDRLLEPVLSNIGTSIDVPGLHEAVRSLSQSFNIKDVFGRQVLARYLYAYLKNRGVEVRASDLVLRRLTGLSRAELESLVFPAPSETVQQSDQTAQSGAVQTAPSGPTPAPEYSKPWLGSDEVLEALGLSGTNLYGSARRRFLTIFGWSDEINSEVRAQLRELEPLYNMLVMRLAVGQVLTPEEHGVIHSLRDILNMYAPDRDELMRLEASALFNPANFAVTRALYHLITNDPKSRLSIALRRTYLGTAGGMESGIDTLTDLGLAAFHFAAEFVRTTPPGARVGNFGVMPSDPDEVAQFLKDNLLALMIRHALRRTDREEAFATLHTLSLEQSLGPDEEERTLGEILAGNLTVQSPEHGGPVLREDAVREATREVEQQQEQPARRDRPRRDRPSRFAYSGYQSPYHLEGGISEALRRQDEIVRQLQLLPLHQEALELEESRSLLREEIRRVRDEERSEQLGGLLSNLNDLQRRLGERLDEIREVTAGYNVSEKDYRDIVRYLMGLHGSSNETSDLVKIIRTGLEKLQRGDYSDFVEVDLEALSRGELPEDPDERDVPSDSGQGDRPRQEVSPAVQPATTPAVSSQQADRAIQGLPLSYTVGYLRYISNVLSELEAGSLSLDEARRQLRGVQLFALNRIVAKVPLWIGDRQIEVTVFPGGRVAVLGRTLALEERDPYPLPPEAVNTIPQQVLNPVELSDLETANIVLRLDEDNPGLVIDAGVMSTLGRMASDDRQYAALDIETDPETNRFLQGALVLYRQDPLSGELEMTQRLVLSDVAQYMAHEQLTLLVERIMARHTTAEARSREIVEALGISDRFEEVKSLFERYDRDAWIANEIMQIEGVLLSEREALTRYVSTLLEAHEQGRQLVVQNVAFDIPYLIGRLEEYDEWRLAARLRRIDLLRLLDVAEMASIAGYAQVNLEYLGQQTGALEPTEREAHLALEDAILTAQVAHRLQERISGFDFSQLGGNQYLIGLGAGRLYDVTNEIPEQVMHLSDRVFRVVRAGYSEEQNRAVVELEEVQFHGDKVVPVRRLRFEPMLDETQQVQPMWQVQQELNRMFTFANEAEARRVYKLSMEDAFRREVERVLSPDLPPEFTVRRGQLPSEYEREGIITSMMTLLRARAIAEGAPESTDVNWVRETLNASISDELAFDLVQRAAYYLTTPYARDPRRQEVYRRVWQWWNEEKRRERLGELMSSVLERGLEKRLSWAEMTMLWREVISREIEDAGIPNVPVELPSYRAERRNLYVALSRGGFATVSLPVGLSEQAQESWLLYRTRVNLRRQVIGASFGIPGGESSLFGSAYESSARADVALLSTIEDPKEYERVMWLMAERRARALHLQNLAMRLQDMEDMESAEAVAIQNRMQEHITRMEKLDTNLRGSFSSDQIDRARRLRNMHATAFSSQLQRDDNLRRVMDDYILRVVLSVDTQMRRFLESGEQGVPRWWIPPRDSAVPELLDLSDPAEAATERVAVERYSPSPRLLERLEEEWVPIVQRARERNVAERLRQTLHEIGVRGSITEADISTRIPLHSAVLALHDVVSELAARGQPVTLADVSELMRQRLGADVLQIGRYHRLDLTNPQAAAGLVGMMRRSAGWIRRYTDVVDEDWLDYISSQMYRLKQYRGMAVLGASGVLLDQPERTPFPIEMYSDWIRTAWSEISPNAWAPIDIPEATTTGDTGGTVSAPIAQPVSGQPQWSGSSSADVGQAILSSLSGGLVAANVGSLMLSLSDDLLIAGAGLLSAAAVFYHRRRRRNDDEEDEGSREERVVRRGTGIVGATRFLVHANPFVRQPGHHVRFDSDYRRPSQFRLRRMERDMEELI